MIFINNIDPILVQFSVFTIRWYGLFFAIGLMTNYLLERWIFKREKHNPNDLDSMAVYLFIGLIVGARIGHAVFYNFDYFSGHPLEIFQIWHGGLSSHGAAIGVFIAYLTWTFVHKIKFTKYADLLVIGMPITAMFVRIGNFFNSEIVGYKTGGNFGVVFKRLGEDFSRHPAQLYEAVLNFFIFIILFFLYKKYFKKTPKLFFVFLYMLMYFLGRFFIEFYKDLHVFDASFLFSMGQILSIIPILIPLFYFGKLAISKFVKHSSK